jgi:hypothetical protein
MPAAGFGSLAVGPMKTARLAKKPNPSQVELEPAAVRAVSV